MSVASPITAEDHWFIGEDKTLRYFVTTGPEIRMSEAASNGAVALTVHPIREALSNGDRVRFGNIVATLSAAAVVGATALAVTALTGYLYREQRGAKVQDLTGFALQWVLRESAESTVATLTKATGGTGITITDAANGVCEVAITDTDTLTLEPGRYFKTLRRSDAGSEVVLSYGKAELQQPATRD